MIFPLGDLQVVSRVPEPLDQGATHWLRKVFVVVQYIHGGYFPGVISSDHITNTLRPRYPAIFVGRLTEPSWVHIRPFLAG